MPCLAKQLGFCLSKKLCRLNGGLREGSGGIRLPKPSSLKLRVLWVGTFC